MTNYKAKLHEDITELQAATKRGELPREVRLVKIEAMTEEYFDNTGEMPVGATLERLADLCLYEELTDDDEHKVAHNEYPILSERQFDRRESKEHATGEIELNAVDGRKHGKPDRRKRTDYENRFVDKKARSRNRERARQYREFTKVQPIHTRKMSL